MSKNLKNGQSHKSKGVRFMTVAEIKENKILADILYQEINKFIKNHEKMLKLYQTNRIELEENNK